jgi:subtilase family serine protease
MIRRLSTPLLAIALASVVSMVCQAESLPAATRHVREVTLNGQARLVGHLPATRSMSLNIVLQMRNRAGLQSFLQEIYDPSSPLYRQFLTVEQFTTIFGPSQADYDAVVRFAEANGFTVIGGSRDAMDVQLRGTVGAVEAAFHVSMGVYQHPTENRNFYAPDREPTVDLPFQLWHISGLDNYSIPRPALVRKDLSEIHVSPNAITGSCPDESFCGSDMRAAYYGGTKLTGSGQNIGLLEYAGFDIADVNTYYTNAGQKRTVAVTGISTDGTSLTCLANQGCDDTEQTIDITQAAGMAPGATTIYMYVGSSDTALLGAMSSDKPLPAQLSSSWIWEPSDPGTDNPYWEKMASQGQNFFQASGDDGKFNSGYPTWPCDAAYVTSVGGTDLETTGPGGAWMSETAWSQGGGGYWAPDGIPIPSWQKATAKGCADCSQTLRNAPDVSANANFTFYVCADQTTCTANLYGGTSFAAPMWAGYLSLLNQKEAAAGHKSVGFINPAIYAAGLSKNYDSDFHDITVGSNGYPATTGYDLATGWGSPKAGNSIVGGVIE